nr:hypothetical protein [Piscicoccus intestinalis]
MHRYATPAVRQHPPAPTTHRTGLEPQLSDFLCARLLEELPAARQRRARSGELHETLARLIRGQDLDDTTLRLLLLAYRSHPQFRPEWETVRTPADVGEVPRSG